jgi:hypothetical protein
MGPLPNATQLERAVDSACQHLISRWHGDARELGHGWKGYSYYSALREARNADWSEEICRQFAKLAIVWAVWPRYSKPKVFELPFSRGIIRLFLERNYLVTDAQGLRTDDKRVVSCFEDAHRRLLLMSYESIDQTRDPDVVSWRNSERKRAAEMGLDWTWMIFYRVDQHVYHLGRTEARVRWEYSRGTPMVERRAGP